MILALECCHLPKILMQIGVKRKIEYRNVFDILEDTK